MGNEHSTEANLDDLKLHNVPIKLPPAKPGGPLPAKDELEARFQHVLASVNVNSESAGFLHNYTDEQKWKLICDHDGAIVKTSPSEFVEKLRNAVNMSNHKKYKKNAPATLQLLRELEISLRTNHVGWVKQFIREFNGLDALVDFLKFACWGLIVATINVKDNEDDDQKTNNKELHDVMKQFDTMRRSNSLPSRRIVKNSRFLLDRDEVHLTILCFRAIMNYQYGLTECVSHKAAMDQICLALNTNNFKTKVILFTYLVSGVLVS